jgi:hypothetical protein
MPSAEETRAMQEIMNKLNNAQSGNQSSSTLSKNESRVPGNVSPDAQEMYNILNKLQTATESSAKNLVQESTTYNKTETKNNSFGVGGLNVVLNKTSVNGFKKTFYTITENGKTIHSDLALFESAMAIIKNLLDKNDLNRTDKIVDLDNRYSNYLYEAASYKQRAKTLTEGVKQDVFLAKHQVAADKMKSIKSQIKKML